MSYTVKTTGSFDKAYKLCLKRGYDATLFKNVLTILMRDGKLPPEYKPHKLSSKFEFAWECHIKPDWLLVWKQDDKELTLILTHTGTHSDIFG